MCGDVIRAGHGVEWRCVLFIIGGHNARNKRECASIIECLLRAVLFLIFRDHCLLCQTILFVLGGKIGRNDLHFETFRLMLLVLWIDVIGSTFDKIGL